MNANTVQTFINKNLGTIRVFVDDQTEWFVVKDVCDILAIKNNRDAISRLDDDEKMTVALTDSHVGKRGGAQRLSVVNEYGLWQLVLGSRKPQAKEFKRWLTHDVIPAVRKNGGYIDGMEHLDQQAKAKLEAEVQKLNQQVKDYRCKNEKLSAQVDRLVKVIERDTTGDFNKSAKPNTWSDAAFYDLDVEGYAEFQSEMEMFNFSDYTLFEEVKSIINASRKRYIDNSAAKHLISEVQELFVARNSL